MFCFLRKPNIYFHKEIRNYLMQSTNDSIKRILEKEKEEEKENIINKKTDDLKRENIIKAVISSKYYILPPIFFLLFSLYSRSNKNIFTFSLHKYINR
jgi:hypothetical protein